jgi:hypothetical protein
MPLQWHFALKHLRDITFSEQGRYRHGWAAGLIVYSIIVETDTRKLLIGVASVKDWAAYQVGSKTDKDKADG